MKNSRWWTKKLQFGAHGEIFELYVQGEHLYVYTNGTRHRPEHEAQLEAVEPRAAAAEIHQWVREWIGPCPLTEERGYASRNPLADDVHWVWEWFPGWALCDDRKGNGWDLYSRAEYLEGASPPAMYGWAEHDAADRDLIRLVHTSTEDTVTHLSEAEPYVTHPTNDPDQQAWVRVIHVHTTRRNSGNGSGGRRGPGDATSAPRRRAPLRRVVRDVAHP